MNFEKFGCERLMIESVLRSTQRNMLIREYCADNFGYFNLVDTYYRSYAENAILMFLVILTIYPLLFMCIALIADKYLSEGMRDLAKRLALSPTLAAVTLIAFANGAPDVINSIQSSKVKSEGMELALGALVGAFLFSSTLVMGNVLHRAHSKKLKVPTGPFLKEMGMYLFSLSLIAFQAYVGTISTLFVVTYFLMYVVYIWLSILLRERAQEEIIGERIQEAVSGDDIENHSSEAESRMTRSSFLLRKTFWDKESNSIVNFLLFPFKILHLLTLPNEGLSNSSDNSVLFRLFVLVIKIVSSFISLFLSLTQVFNVDLILSLKICSIVPFIYGVVMLVPALRWMNKYFVQIFCLLGSLALINISVGFTLDSVFIISFLIQIERLFVIMVVVSAGNTIGDYFANGSLADMGNETMAFLASFSGQTFNLLVGFWFNLILRNNNDFDIFGWNGKAGPTSSNVCLRLLFMFAVGSIAINTMVGVAWKFQFVKGHRTVMFFYYFIFVLVSIIFVVA